jgi:hypothetical protein
VHAGSHRVQARVQDPYEESARSGCYYCAVFPYAHDCSVGADQLISGYENIGDLPIDGHEALAVRHWVGGCASG